MPYAVTFKVAITFCCLLLVPATSKVTSWEVLSYSISTLLTWMDESVSQFEKPDVFRVCAATAPLARAAAATTAPHAVVLAIIIRLLCLRLLGRCAGRGGLL